MFLGLSLPVKNLKSIVAAEGNTEAHRGGASCPAGSERSRMRAQVWSRVPCWPLSYFLWSQGPRKGSREQDPGLQLQGLHPSCGRWEPAPWPAPALAGELGQQRAQPQGVPSFAPEDAAVKGRLVECLETVLNETHEPPKSQEGPALHC